MNWEQRCLRCCAAVLLCAVLLRLGESGALAPLGAALENPAVASFLVYLQTGRVVRVSAQALPTEPPATEPPEPTAPEQKTLPTFTAGDLSLVSVEYNCSYDPDLESLLTEPLDWDLRADEPTVLILHTHTTECYTKTAADSFVETSSFRTLDPGYNMLCLGDIVAAALEEAGIGVIHDRQFHDYPSYNGSYAHAASSTKEYLEQYPGIRLILDLHRDAADTAYGQMSTSCTIGGQTAAQLMMVVGTDAGGLDHPDWEENLSLALKLQVTLEQKNPGICRDLNLTYQRYNQHLGDRALLIEIGAAGNTLPQARLAAQALAEAIIALADGSA